MTKNHYNMNERALAQIEIDYLRDELMKTKEKLKDVSIARKLLAKNGYYVSNLWCIDDITENYDCTPEKAYQVLELAMKNTATIEQIWHSIDDACDTLEIHQIKN